MTRSFLVAGLLPLSLLGGADAPAQRPPGGEAIQPGQWEMATEMTSVEAAGLPEEMVQELRGRLASQRQVRSQCITPEQARNPTHNMMGRQNPAGCEFSETFWAGGVFRIRAVCQPPGSGPMQMSITGGYAARRFDGRIDINMEMPDPAGTGPALPLQMEGRMTGRRTGDCRS